MDTRKAFDNVKRSMLFTKLLQKGVPEIYIRLLMVMYENQIVNVKWNGLLSYIRNEKWGQTRRGFISVVILCVRGRTL